MAKQVDLEPVGRVLDMIDWRWLEDNFPELAEVIQDAVNEGVEPDELRRYVMQRNGRFDFANRCHQAARWLAANA